MPICQTCQNNFTITVEDKNFYQKVNVTEPKNCPHCRNRRRLSFRNERNLYSRVCDLSKKPIISMYSSDKPYKIYAHDIWWSDKWDARNYGQEFDFSRSFFEQFQELQLKVPRINMIISHCENSDYAPYSVSSRNCYMCVSVFNSEDLYYCYQTNKSKDSLDCSISYNCELCYECIYRVNLYNCINTENCRTSQNLFLCRDCQGCSNLIGCVNLSNKNYHIFNRPVSKEEFEKTLTKLKEVSEIEKFQEKFEEFSKTQFFRENYSINSENSSGNHLLNCKNAQHCFDAEGLEDCKFIYVSPKGSKDCYDYNYSPNGELLYDCLSSVNSYNCKFLLHAWDNKNCAYLDECFYSSNLFGCIGLKRNQYCILNKQYTKEDYENLLPKIIEHMKTTNEWGEFFPTSISPFAYNETIASEQYPLSKEKTLNWKEKDHKEYQAGTYKIPANISEVTDEILKQILACKNCGKNYRIIPQELKFYRKMQLSIPLSCPDCRHTARIKKRTPHAIYLRKCGKCQKDIHTSYEKEPIVYCEKCYLELVY